MSSEAVIACYITASISVISSLHCTSTMMKTRSCLVFAAVIQVIFCRNSAKVQRKGHRSYQGNIPRFCWNLPRDIDLDKCCPIPNLYSDEVLESCGFDKPLPNGSGIPVRPKGPKTLLPFCRDGLCLMKNANLLTDDSRIDYDKLDHYIDKWASANPEYSEAIMAAKPVCLQEYDEPDGGEPERFCAQDRIYVCLNSRLLWNCDLKPYKECLRLQDHMDKCRPFYTKIL